MTLRRFGSKSLVNLKSDNGLKSAIRTELKDLINSSIQDYLQKNKIPIATIDINVDKDCIRCHSSKPNETGRAVRLNISTSSMDVLTEPMKNDQENKIKTNNDDNQHWMTWKTYDDKANPTRSSYDIKNSRSQTPVSGHKHQSSSPFIRPKTATGHGNQSDDYREPNTYDQAKKTRENDDDNRHWMYWQTHENKTDLAKSYDFKNSRCQTPVSGHRYRCPSPFVRPSSATGHGNHSTGYRVADSYEEYPSYSIRPTEGPRFLHTVGSSSIPKPMSSVAVGPDKHFEELGTNTHRSYQISDYLKKNMNLNDPYERSIYSNLMEVMRTKTKQHCGDDSEPTDIDPIIQVSEYKHRFRNPGSKIAFPTSHTQTLVTVKKPPICPHKSRSNGTVRPQTASTSRIRSGEQFLY